jgi:hypothetical protein
MVDEKRPSKYSIGPPNYNPGKRTIAQKNYFFLDGKLYKVIRQDKGANLLTCRDFNDEGKLGKVVTFILSDAKRRMKNAYDTGEVAGMLNRNHAVIQTYVNKGFIAEPVQIYPKGRNANGTPFFVRKWSDDDILALHEFLLTLGAGRPRKDGVQYSATRIPTRQEVLAMLRNQPSFYMKTSSGEFVPVWSAYNEV